MYIYNKIKLKKLDKTKHKIIKQNEMRKNN